MSPLEYCDKTLLNIGSFCLRERERERDCVSKCAQFKVDFSSDFAVLGHVKKNFLKKSEWFKRN